MLKANHILFCILLTSLSANCYADAIAVLQAKSGSKVAGQLLIQAEDDHLLVSGNISGLQANQKHAIHIHEFGDCTAADGSSAGKHFNPHNKLHGHPQSDERHLGDLPNIQADENGLATVEFTIDSAKLDNSEYGIIDRALIIHQQADDYRSQPAGNAGTRIACAVIQAK